MSIDNLAIGEVGKIFEILGGDNSLKLNTDVKESMLSEYIGKYVIVRSKNEGINAGFVKDISKYGVVLSEARRLHYHKPLDKRMSWYEGVAESGIDSGCRVSNPVTKVIVEDYSITVCSTAAKISISQVKTHEQS